MFGDIWPELMLTKTAWFAPKLTASTLRPLGTCWPSPSTWGRRQHVTTFSVAETRLQKVQISSCKMVLLRQNTSSKNDIWLIWLILTYLTYLPWCETLVSWIHMIWIRKKKLLKMRQRNKSSHFRSQTFYFQWPASSQESKGVMWWQAICLAMYSSSQKERE